MRLGTLLLAATIPFAASAQIQKCVDAKGGVTFQHEPCEREQVAPAAASTASDQDKAQRKREADQNLRAVAADLEAQLKKKQENWLPPPLPSIDNASPTSHAVSMGFEQCNAATNRVAMTAGGRPQVIRIVNTPLMTMTRICASDGSVLITCSKPDQTMVTTKSVSC